MMRTMEVPGDKGTVKITGDDCGAFFIHESSDDEVVLENPTWRVTLTSTGAKFPWEFVTREAAEAFIADVADALDWAAVAVRQVASSGVAEWTGGTPTKEQNARIVALAKARGAFRA